jgi:predicted glutamine amidotransferase
VCGLVGFVGFLEHKHKVAMKELLYLNALRGKDSTGLSAVKRDRTVLTRKMTVPSYEFIEHPAVERAMTHGDQLWMGHSRFKTTGEVSKANAHPFEVEDENGDILLVGTHNGTLNNKYEIDKLLGDKFDTDSEALFNFLVEAPNFKDAIKKLRGAWSLVFWDPTTNSVHFCRNNERPMVYAYSKDRKVFVYASEAWMILAACRRNGVELETNDKGLSCYSTNVDTLYSLAIPQERDQELPELRKEGGYVGAPTTNFWKGRQNGGWDWWNDDENNPSSEIRRAAAAQGTKETTPNRAAPKPVITIGLPEGMTGQIRGFNGAAISTEAVDKIKAKGCGWCKGNINKVELFAFLGEETVVCVRCMRDTHPKGGVFPAKESEDYDLDDEPFDPIAFQEEDDEPFDVSPPAENSEEYKELMAKSAAKAVG